MNEKVEREKMNAKIIVMTRQLRDDPEVWPIFERVGFREYMTMDEIRFLARKIPNAGFLQKDDLPIKGDDWKISIGLLERLADGLLTDADLEGAWTAGFIEDRWHTLSEGEGIYRKSTRKPIELGWIMALAREIDADPKYWNYFKNLTEFEHDSPRDRPLPNPIQDRLTQFRVKHCLHNRDSSLGIWPLLYSKHEKYAHLQHAKIDDITDIEQVKKALADRNSAEPSLIGGFNLDVYFEDLNR